MLHKALQISANFLPSRNGSQAESLHHYGFVCGMVWSELRG